MIGGITSVAIRIRPVGALAEQDDVGPPAATGDDVGLPAATSRGRGAAGQVEGGEGSGHRPDALQEPPTVDASQPRRLSDGTSDEFVGPTVARCPRRGSKCTARDRPGLGQKMIVMPIMVSASKTGDLSHALNDTTGSQAPLIGVVRSDFRVNRGDASTGYLRCFPRILKR